MRLQKREFWGSGLEWIWEVMPLRYNLLSLL